MDRLLLKPVEVAEVTGLGRSKVYQLLAAGEIPAIRVGGRLRVPTESLRDWIARQVPEARPRTA